MREKIAEILKQSQDSSKTYGTYQLWRDTAVERILTLLKEEIERRLLTDEDFLEWCGSHRVIGCGGTREMEGVGRIVSICEDCRAQAQLQKILSLLR